MIKLAEEILFVYYLKQSGWHIKNKQQQSNNTYFTVKDLPSHSFQCGTLFLNTFYMCYLISKRFYVLQNS